MLYGTENIEHDVNTLNFYALVCHLIFVAFYFYGYQVADYHNYAAKLINGLTVLRLFYFGNREFFSRIAIIEHCKNWLFDSRCFVNNYINGMTIALFVLCAIPLFTLIYFINTDQMRVTGIAIILFAFFTAIEKSDKNKTAKTSRDATAKINNDVIIQVVMPTNVVAPQGDAKDVDFFNIEFFKDTCKMLAIALVLVLAGGQLVMYAREQTMFSLGYASGYTDGKSGAKPKSETDFKKLMRCSFGDQSSKFDSRFDPECMKEPK